MARLPKEDGGGGGRTYLDGVSPTLKQTETELADLDTGGRGQQPTDTTSYAITPISTLRLGGTVQWNTDTKQTQCGETVTDNSGEDAHRLNMEATLTHSQFKKLNTMRDRSTTIKLISAGYTGPATFDQLKWDRIEDANGTILPSGLEITEPMYLVQLQSQQDKGN
jgi:hypothetical protein